MKGKIDKLEKCVKQLEEMLLLYIEARLEI